MSVTLEHICKNTFTVSDLHRRLGLLQECLEEVLFHTGAQTLGSIMSAGVVHAKKVGSDSDVQALKEWGDDVWNEFHSHNLVKQIEQLRKEGEILPSFTLYVPVVFDEESTKEIGLWCRENIDPRILLELIVEASVVGGCAFVSKDTYHDFSLHEAMNNSTGVVRELLNSYV